MPTRDHHPLQRPLRDYLAVPAVAGEFFLTAGTSASDHHPMQALQPGTLEGWMVNAAHDHPDMDDKARAAYLVGDLAHGFALAFAAMHLARCGVPDVEPSAVAMAARWYPRAVPGKSDTGLRYTPRLLADPEHLHAPLDLPAIGALAVAVHEPIIAYLHARTRLSRKALWRLVADSVSAGWLVIGKRLGKAADAMAAAQAIVHVPGSPLGNKQTRFVEIALSAEDDPGRVVAREWFRARGGCCRYYTTAASAGEYCTTCVLRSDESREQRLRALMRSRLADA